MIRALALISLCAMLLGATAPPSGPLPHSIEPKAYVLDLTIDPSSTRFHGHVEIQAQLLTPVHAIFIHGQDLKVTRARASGGLDVTYTEVGPTGLARLDFPRTIAPGPLTLSFDYTAELGTSADGLFHTKVGNDWYAWTQFEPTSARRMFPSFDEPRFKTPFEITVRAPRNARVFSNSSELASSDEKADRPAAAADHPGNALRTHHFAPTAPLPTYLIALGVGPFDVSSTTAPPNAVRSRPIPMQIAATKGQLPRLALATRELPKLLALLEQYTGVPYPYDKLDFLASPTMGGAMENAGLIIVSDVFLLLDPNPPVSQLRGFAEVNTHELAHQWFGDLVTPAWWSDLWLSESFAQWLGRKVAHQWRPDLGIDATALQEVFEAMKADALGQSRAIRQPIATDNDITSAFDSITYEKGEQVLSMFESYLGAPAFGASLKRYLTSYRHKTASAEDFFRCLTETTGDPTVAAALRTFTDQTGVPLVQLEKRERTLILKQTRYRPLGIDAAAPQLWRIPVCLTWGGAHRTCSMLDKLSRSLSVPQTQSVLIPDIEGTGYYRFHMDESGWSEALSVAPKLSPRAALSMADSLWADFEAGAVGFDRVLEGARALSRHSDRLAATELGMRLAHLADTTLTDEQLPRYRSLMHEIYAPRLAALGLDPHSGAYSQEAIPVRSLRESLVDLVALQARDPHVRGQLLSAAVAYLHGDIHALDPAFRKAALQIVVQERGPPIMNDLRAAMIRTADPLLREHIVTAIGSTNTPEGARAALDLAWSADFNINERLTILWALAHERGTRESAIHFVDLNFDHIVQTLPSFARPLLLPALFEYDCSMPQADRADSFIRPRLPLLGAGQQELAQTRETIRLCAVLRKTKGPEIDAALNLRGPIATPARQASRSRAIERISISHN